MSKKKPKKDREIKGVRKVEGARSRRDHLHEDILEQKRELRPKLERALAERNRNLFMEALRDAGKPDGSPEFNELLKLFDHLSAQIR